MLVHQLTSSDAPAFQALRLFGLRESPNAFGSSFEEEAQRSHAQVAERIAGAADRVFFGAFCDGALAGIVSIGREMAHKARHRAFIRGMYVAPEARRSGVGRALLQAAIECAEAWAGVEQITLVVTANNASAVHLYQNLGFVEYGLAPRALRVGSEYFDELYMVRLKS